MKEKEERERTSFSTPSSTALPVPLRACPLPAPPRPLEMTLAEPSDPLERCRPTFSRWSSDQLRIDEMSCSISNRLASPRGVLRNVMRTFDTRRRSTLFSPESFLSRRSASVRCSFRITAARNREPPHQSTLVKRERERRGERQRRTFMPQLANEEVLLLDLAREDEDLLRVVVRGVQLRLGLRGALSVRVELALRVAQLRLQVAEEGLELAVLGCGRAGERKRERSQRAGSTRRPKSEQGRTGLELLEDRMQVGRALHLAVALLAQHLAVGLCLGELHLDDAEPSALVLAPHALAHRLALPLVALDAHALEVLLRLAQRHLAHLGLVGRGALRVERARAQLLDLGVERVGVGVRLDQLALERVERRAEVVVGGAQVGNLLLAAVELVLQG